MDLTIDKEFFVFYFCFKTEEVINHRSGAKVVSSGVCRPSNFQRFNSLFYLSFLTACFSYPPSSRLTVATRSELIP